MLSIVVVGRNDSHGYNLSKRVASSLNSLSLPMSKGDELIFVDWNSDNNNPPFPLAIFDTLTTKTKEHLIIYRVPRRIHEKVSLGARQPIIEPIARNVGIKRANNPWVLSTNTDIILDLGGKTYESLLSSLEPALYHAFRYEIPEFVWDHFDRANPHLSLEVIQEQLSDKSLFRNITTQPVTGHRALFPDGVGDFQLAPKNLWEEIKGFPEEMLRPWHVDSRLSFQLEKISKVESKILKQNQLRAYHQNHLRSSSYLHTDAPANPVEIVEVPYQNDLNWGLWGENLEVIKASHVRQMQSSPRPTKSFNSAPCENLQENHRYLHYFENLTYFFLSDEIVNLPINSTIWVSSANPDLIRQLSSCDPFLNMNSKNFNFIKLSELEDLQGISPDLAILDYGFPNSIMTEIPVSAVESFKQQVKLNLKILQSLDSGIRVATINASHWTLRLLHKSLVSMPSFNNYSNVISGDILHKKKIAIPFLIHRFQKQMINTFLIQFLPNFATLIAPQLNTKVKAFERDFFNSGRTLERYLNFINSHTGTSILFSLYKQLPYHIRAKTTPATLNLLNWLNKVSR